MNEVTLILTIVFGIVTLTSILVAFRLARRRKPVWAYVTTKIIGLGTDAPERVKIIYNDRQVKEVYRTFVIFFNKGRQTIRKEDVRANIDIVFPDAEILDLTNTWNSDKPQTKVCVHILNSDSIRVNFVFLNYNDGVVVEVLHTAYSQPIDCQGYVLEYGKPRCTGQFIPTKFKFKQSYIVIIAVAIITPIVLTIAAHMSSASIDDDIGIWSFAWIPLVFWFLLGIFSSPNVIKRLRFPRWSRH